MSTPLLDEEVLSADRSRPLHFVNATGADLVVAGTLIAAVDPERVDNAVVVDCTGLAVVPVFSPSISSLAPGRPATFALVPSASVDGHTYEKVIWWPSQAAAIVVDGEFVLLNGVSRTPLVPPAPASSSPHLGLWIDATGFVHQQLTPDGRYDETRGGRRHAYQGSFWIEGDRIAYRDDLGFWAYGRFAGEVLHHAGYTFTRPEEPPS